MTKTEKGLDKTAYGIFLVVLFAYVYIFWQILRTLWPAIVHQWGNLTGILHKAGPGGCDTACTLSLLPPGMTAGGLLLVAAIVFLGFLVTIAFFRRLTCNCFASS
ncbi:MAG: hypothetical protein U1D31_00485 [Patescibacteria group bacterium]|nr:hypothetical protein [bacterium]MDZ4240598.1 hypothetical protein [Patescibacteria group bacterium]